MHRHSSLSRITFLRRVDFGRWVYLKIFCGKHLVLWKVTCSIKFNSLLVMSLSWLVISCQRLKWHTFICSKAVESVWMNKLFCFSSIALNQESNGCKTKLKKCFWGSDNHYLQKGQWVMCAPTAESKLMQLLRKGTLEPDKGFLRKKSDFQCRHFGKHSKKK